MHLNYHLIDCCFIVSEYPLTTKRIGELFALQYTVITLLKNSAFSAS